MTDADRLKEIDAYFTAPPNHLSWRQIARELFAIARRALERADKAEELAAENANDYADDTRQLINERDAARASEKDWRERCEGTAEISGQRYEQLRKARAEADALRAALKWIADHNEAVQEENDYPHVCVDVVNKLEKALSAGASKRGCPDHCDETLGDDYHDENCRYHSPKPAAVTPACEVLKGCRDPQSHWHHIWVEAAEPKETRSGFSSLYSGHEKGRE